MPEDGEQENAPRISWLRKGSVSGGGHFFLNFAKVRNLIRKSSKFVIFRIILTYYMLIFKLHRQAKDYEANLNLNKFPRAELFLGFRGGSA